MKNYRKIFLIFLIFLLPFSSFAISPKIIIDDMIVNFETTPISKKGITLVPLEPIFKYFGAKVKYDSKDNSITAVKDNIFIRMHIDSELASINGKNIILDAPATMVDNNIMVPARFIAEAFNAKIDWDERTKTVLINSDKGQLRYMYPFYLSKSHIKKAKDFAISKDQITINDWILNNYSLKPYFISKDKYIQPYIITPYSSLVSLYSYDGINDTTDKAVDRFSTYISLFKPISFNIILASKDGKHFENIENDLNLSLNQVNNNKLYSYTAYTIDNIKRIQENNLYLTNVSISFYEIGNGIDFFEPVILNINHKDTGNIEYNIDLYNYK